MKMICSVEKKRDMRDEIVQMKQQNEKLAMLTELTNNKPSSTRKNKRRQRARASVDKRKAPIWS